MSDAATDNETVTLKDGVTVTIRAIRPDDKAGILEAFRNLQPESIYSRFFYQKKTLTGEELKSLTEVDFENEVALVVTTGGGDKETIIGVGRFAIVDAPGSRRSAELAFTVEEDFHGQGIAGCLLERLARLAREKGISQLEAEILAKNQAMIAVFARSGLPMKQSMSGGVVHVTLSLTDTMP
jgi:RimJ/RimL family protein N-acetyltransferase